MALFELHERPDVAAPALVVALDGGIDAGLGMASATSAILEKTEMTTVATFDTDNLLDHRARRPTVQLVDGMQESLSWPSIELRLGHDTKGGDALFLLG